MYLSKLELNPRSREARRDLAQPYELHRTLARAFPAPEGQDYRAAHGVLFRLEPALAPGGRPFVLVQSLTAPIWPSLPTDYLRGLAQAKPLVLACTAGQVLGFRLVANPTKKVTAPGQRQGKRVALLDTGGDGPTPAQQWLRRKAELGGFDLLHVLTEEFHLGSGRPAVGAGKLQLPLHGVRFDGLLRVSDPVRLQAAVRSGIGPAKAFGFGLLSLARPFPLMAADNLEK